MPKLLRIRRRHILAMPMIGFAAQFARALGISKTLLSRWIHKEDAPARAVGKTVRGRGGYWQIRRREFTDWLVATGRYKRGRGYDE